MSLALTFYLSERPLFLNFSSSCFKLYMSLLSEVCLLSCYWRHSYIYCMDGEICGLEKWTRGLLLKFLKIAEEGGNGKQECCLGFLLIKEMVSNQS